MNLQECHRCKSCNATLMSDMLQFNVGGIPHTKQLISLEYKDQHKALCYEYKNAIVAKG